MASATSAKTEIKLLNVAKASLQELLEDYEDYLKTRGHRQWEEGSAEYESMRRLGREHNDSEFFMNLAQSRPPETIANMAIILIKQADYLLHKQLQRLSDDFIKEGKLKVSCLSTDSSWFGMTYKEDRQIVADELVKLHTSGIYPDKKLFS